MVSTRRRRRTRQPLVVLGVVFVALVIVALMWTFSSGDATPGPQVANAGSPHDGDAAQQQHTTGQQIAGTGSGDALFSNTDKPKSTDSAGTTKTTTDTTKTTTTGTTGSSAGATTSGGNAAGTPAANATSGASGASGISGGGVQIDASVRSSGDAPRLGIDIQTPFKRGMKLITEGELVRGRTVLSALLTDGTAELTADQATVIRNTLNDVSRDLIFSPTIHTEDPLTTIYTVEPGDLLSRITPKYGLTDALAARINRIDPNKIRIGQRLKLINGPFHAVVDKSEFRMDLFLHDAGGKPVYIYSLPVGLGEDDSTPAGTWVVRPRGKVERPSWRNPRTGEFFERDDPKNPLGRYWIGLLGTDDATKPLDDYGIHGTNEPDSVGKQMSMGCVRLRDQDIELLYHLLVEGKSTVRIQP